MIILTTGQKNKRKAYIIELCEQQGVDYAKAQHFYADDFEEQSFESRVPVNTGLFGERECFVLHNVARELFLAKVLKHYADTEHLLIFSEDSVVKKDRETFQKYHAHIQEFEKEEKKEAKKYNTFALADLLGEKNKKKLWLAFREAVESGVSAEEIHGVLFWQLKTLALVKRGATDGMNDYVVRKNEVFAHYWTSKEIQTLANHFTKIYHQRDTYSTLEIEMEKLILSL